MPKTGRVVTRDEAIRDELAQYADECPNPRQSLASLLTGAEETLYQISYARAGVDPLLQLVDAFGVIIDHPPLAIPLGWYRKLRSLEKAFQYEDMSPQKRAHVYLEIVALRASLRIVEKSEGR